MINFTKRWWKLGSINGGKPICLAWPSSKNVLTSLLITFQSHTGQKWRLNLNRCHPYSLLLRKLQLQTDGFLYCRHHTIINLTPILATPIGIWQRHVEINNIIINAAAIQQSTSCRWNWEVGGMDLGTWSSKQKELTLSHSNLPYNGIKYNNQLWNFHLT